MEKIHGDLVFEIARLADKSFGIDRIHAQLKKSGHEVGRATIQAYKARYEKHKLEAKGQHEPVVWHKLPDYGIPLDALSRLLEIWADSRARNMDLNITTPREFTLQRLPTVAEVTWWWRVHLAAPTARPQTIEHIAYNFWWRELVRAAGGYAPDDDDLWALLASRPWQDVMHLRLYVFNLRVGEVSAPVFASISPVVVIDAMAKLRIRESAHAKGWLDEIGLSPKPYGGLSREEVFARLLETNIYSTLTPADTPRVRVDDHQFRTLWEWCWGMLEETPYDPGVMSQLWEPPNGAEPTDEGTGTEGEAHNGDSNQAG